MPFCHPYKLLKRRSNTSNQMASASDPLEESLNDLKISESQASNLSSDSYSSIDESVAQDIIGGTNELSEVDFEDSDLQEAVTSQELEDGHFANEHQVFSLSLPFGGNGNPLSHLPSLKTITKNIPVINNIPIIGNNLNEKVISDNDFHVQVSREEIGSKLSRRESTSTLEEAFYYSGRKGTGSSRLRAVTDAFTPNLSITSITDILDEKKKTVWDELDGDIVVLGGYRGSVLKDAKTHDRIWIPIRAGLNMKKINLLLGPDDEDEVTAQKEVYSDDILSHIGPIDISRKLVSKLKNGKTNVHIFGYDWRLSPHISAKRLHNFLQELNEKKSANKNKKGTIVIAHSMGGLIAHHAMQQDPSLFRGLLYVGVPAECPNTLGPLRQGDRVLMSTKILTAEVNFFMRSSFVFLPLDGRCFINRKTSKDIKLDYFDVNTWIDLNLSPPVSDDRVKEESKHGLLHSLSFNSDAKFATTFDVAKDYLKRTLKRTKQFLLELEYDSEKNYPPLVIVYGNQVPTVRGVRVDSIDAIKKGDYSDLYYGPGDGVVNHKWLMPERKGFPVNAKIASDKGHISLMCDLDAMGQALEEILLAEKETIRY